MRTGSRILVLTFLLMSVTGFGRSPYWHGNDKFNRGDYRGAIEAYTMAIKADSVNFGAWIARAMAHEHLNELEMALADYDRAIQIVPGFSKAYHYRGHVHQKLTGDDRAIADYDQALASANEVVLDANGMSLTVDKTSLYYDRGNAYFRLGRYEAAVASYDSSLLLGPKFAAAYNNRGASRVKLGDREGGCRDRSKACELGLANACGWARDSCGTP